MDATLNPQQIEDLQHEIINDAMAGALGLAIAKMKRKGINFTTKQKVLNDELFNIHLKARREMKKRIIDYFNAIGY